MSDSPLDIDDDLPRIEFVRAPVQVLGDGPKLDDEIAGQILRLDLASFLPPKARQGDLVIAHDGPCVGAADDGAAVLVVLFPHVFFHAFASLWNRLWWF